jgi:chromosome segregation ATPase
MTTDEKLDVLIAQVGNLADKQAEGFDHLAGLALKQEARLDRHETLLGRIDSRMSEIDSTTRLLAHLYAQTRERLDDHERRIAALEAKTLP